jgi:hypothetical protein
MRRFLRIVLTLISFAALGVLLLVGLIALSVFTSRLRTDARVEAFVQQYEESVRHPENTKRLLLKTRITHGGSAPSCNPTVIDIRSYNLGDEERIKEFYKGKEIVISEHWSAPVGTSFPDEAYRRTFSFDKDLMRWLAEPMQ